MNSRNKGKRGELECAEDHRTHWGVEARRGAQYAGGTDSPDVVTSLAGCHCEAKRVEAGNPYDWIAQAIRDAGGKIAYVWHRRNNKDALLICRFADFPKLARAWVEHEKSRPGGRLIKMPGRLVGLPDEPAYAPSPPDPPAS